MGGAGGPPAPVGDSPTGTGESSMVKGPFRLARTIASIPSGVRRTQELPAVRAVSPDGTGQWPVPPMTDFSNTLYGTICLDLARLGWDSFLTQRAQNRYSKAAGQPRKRRSGPRAVEMANTSGQPPYLASGRATLPRRPNFQRTNATIAAKSKKPILGRRGSDRPTGRNN